ncbi:hypothetical protein, partial [Frankia sp. Cj3]|uniref:hypothetical protein n=1 Tax=Frankia sp. Cj3 TaxID=2880976 RepID=UPI001EF5362E
ALALALAVAVGLSGASIVQLWCESESHESSFANADTGLMPTKNAVAADIASITTPRPILCVMTFLFSHAVAVLLPRATQ